MNCTALLAIVLPEQPAGIAFVALALTAVIFIPAGFLFGLLWEKMTAKLSKKNS